MKATITLFACMLAAAAVWAQNPSIIDSTRTKMNTVRDQETANSNEALGISGQSKTPAPAIARDPTVPKGMAGVTSVAGPKATVHARKSHADARVKTSALKQTAVPATVTEASAVTAGSEDPASASNMSANGRRDPFLSPVVNNTSTSSCSTGKKCLEIGTINLKGIVKSENGFIAVVSNNMNKAYFLHENDPVFNGYVVRITGDSIVFQETLQDRLGKTFTHEIVKKITTPAV